MTDANEGATGPQPSEIVALLNEVSEMLHAQADTLRVLTAKLFDLSSGLQALAAAVALQPKIDRKRLDRDFATLARRISTSESVLADMRRVDELLRTPRKDN